SLALLTGFQSAPGEVFAGDRTTNACIGAALLAFAVFASVLVFRKSTLAVHVHANGFVWVERGISRRFLWREVVGIRSAHVSRRVQGVEAARSHVHRIILESGAELVATHMLEDVNELAARIERALEERLPTMRSKLAAGEIVSFGPIQ